MIDVNGHASAILGITQQGCVEKLFAIRPFEIFFSGKKVFYPVPKKKAF